MRAADDVAVLGFDDQLRDNLNGMRARKRNHAFRRWAFLVIGAATASVIGLFATGALGVDSTPPPLNPTIGPPSNQTPGPNVIVNSGPGSHFREVTPAGTPENVASVPQSIPAEGVFVNGDFELFPPGSGVPPVSSQQAIVSAESYVRVLNPLAVTTLEANFTFPGSIAGNGQSAIHQLEDVTSWIVDFQIPPTQPTPSGGPGAPPPANNLPKVSNVVVAVEASTGTAYFSTGTP